MKLIRMAPLVILGLIAPAFAEGQTNPPEPPVVIASGDGVVKAAPDQAWVRIGAAA